MHIDRAAVNFFLGLMVLFLFICLLLVFVFPIITTLFTVITGVILSENYYLAGNPNSGWVILFIDTLLVSVALWIRKQK